MGDETVAGDGGAMHRLSGDWGRGQTGRTSPSWTQLPAGSWRRSQSCPGTVPRSFWYSSSCSIRARSSSDNDGTSMPIGRVSTRCNGGSTIETCSTGNYRPGRRSARIRTVRLALKLEQVDVELIQLDFDPGGRKRPGRLPRPARPAAAAAWSGAGRGPV